MSIFKHLFEVILTDNGWEFSKPEDIEFDQETGEKLINLFYCEPYSSWQKGGIERNHEFIRYIIPKGITFDKLTKEAAFQQLSPGGAISYVEVPNLQNNIPAVLALMKHIYNTILYAELNTKSDFCQVCGFDGEIEIKEDENKKLIWQCPNCGNTDQNKMNVARRTCGYIGTQYWNQGRTQEIKERVLHL